MIEPSISTLAAIAVDLFGNDNLSNAAQSANKADIRISQNGNLNQPYAAQRYDNGLITVQQFGVANVAVSNQH